MSEKSLLGVSEALYLKPLLEGLDTPASPFEVAFDLPAALSVNFNRRPEDFRGAFLSPIDYARHGGSYQIVSGIAVSSARPTGSARLYVKDNIRNIGTMAVDVRVTSEILLARLLLLEKFPNLSGEKQPLRIVPMMPDLAGMLSNADAALIAQFMPLPGHDPKVFSLDLIEEWSDMTGLPYVHGFWVVREDKWTLAESRALHEAKALGVEHLSSIAMRCSSELSIPLDVCSDYLSAFTYDFGPEQEQSLSEFLRYSYFHGSLVDVPDLNFTSTNLPDNPAVN